MVRPEQRVQYRGHEKCVDLVCACFLGDMIETVILVVKYVQNEVIDPTLILAKTPIYFWGNIRRISGFVPCNMNKFKGCPVCRLVVGSHLVKPIDIALVALFRGLHNCEAGRIDADLNSFEITIFFARIPSNFGKPSVSQLSDTVHCFKGLYYDESSEDSSQE